MEDLGSVNHVMNSEIRVKIKKEKFHDRFPYMLVKCITLFNSKKKEAVRWKMNCFSIIIFSTLSPLQNKFWIKRNASFKRNIFNYAYHLSTYNKFITSTQVILSNPFSRASYANMRYFNRRKNISFWHLSNLSFKAIGYLLYLQSFFKHKVHFFY